MSIDQHLVPGRKDDTEAVDAVLERAAEGSGVLLYFHGGLSSQDYMETELGKWLLASQFQPQNLAGLYPIFITYDADLFDQDGDGDVDWDDAGHFSVEVIKDFIKQEVFGELLEKLRGLIGGRAEKFAISETDEEALLRETSRAWLLESSDKSVPDDEDIAMLLDDEVRLEALAAEMLAKNEDLRAYTKELHGFANEKGLPVVSLVNTATILPRVLARFAVRMNHEVWPTLAEELYRALVVLSLSPERVAQRHWTKVYRHAEECWRESHNGRYLMQRLKEIQQQKTDVGEPFRIKAMSHSAGSIVIGKLVEHLEAVDGVVLDDIVMLAPAINFETFHETVIRYPQRWRDFRAYVLEENSEETDNLVPVLYTASLLYFVSGFAEKRGGGDKQLLMHRHLQRDRYPYNRWWHNWKFCDVNGGAEAVWDFFDANPDALVLCPQVSDDPTRNNDGSTHENTKFPWVTQALGRAVIHRVTEGAVTDPDLPVPDGADS